MRRLWSQELRARMHWRLHLEMGMHVCEWKQGVERGCRERRVYMERGGGEREVDLRSWRPFLLRLGSYAKDIMKHRPTQEALRGSGCDALQNVIILREA